MQSYHERRVWLFDVCLGLFPSGQLLHRGAAPPPEISEFSHSTGGFSQQLRLEYTLFHRVGHDLAIAEIIGLRKRLLPLQWHQQFDHVRFK